MIDPLFQLHEAELIGCLENSADDLHAVIRRLREALKHCRGPLTPSGLLLQQNLGTAVRLAADLENHRTALVNPLTLDV